MLNDFVKSAQKHVSERLASPIIGGVFISWCLWNYKFLIILLSSASVSKTFELIDTVAFPDFLSILGRGALFPVITAATYIFFYPYPAKFVDGFTRRRQIELNALRQEIENETLLTKEESRIIRSGMFAAQNKHDEMLDMLNAEISRLKADLEAALDPSSQSVTNQNPAGTPISPNLDESQKKLLIDFEKSGSKGLRGEIISRSDTTMVKTEFDLGELVRWKLLKREYDQSKSDFSYEFTHDGRRVVLGLLN